MNTQQKSFLFVLTALAVVFLASVTSPSVASASTIGNWTHMDGEGGIARFVYSKTGIEGIEMHYDVATADKVCQLAGFSGAESFGCASEYQGRCGFVSCYDNTLTKWDGNKFVTGNACSMGNKWLATLKCKNNPISLSVSVSPNPATTGEKVTFNSSVSGGTGSYTYSWTGACTSLSAFCGKSFSNPGTYTSTLTVTSGNQIKSASKSVTVNQACTSHSIKKCSGNVVYWYDSCGTKQEVYQACTANQTCSNGSCVNLQINCYNNSDCNDNNPNTSDVCKNAGTPQSYCQNPSLPIACTSNTDCGISAYTGSPYCFNNNVFQAYQTYACANAGTPQSYCQNSSAPQLQQSCLSNQTCSNGSCVTNPTPPPPPPPPPSNDLVVSCYSTPNPLNVGQQISFISNTTGGNGTYSYSWTGACLGSSQVCSTLFNDPGNRQATITVTSDGQQTSAMCEAGINQNCAHHAYQRCVGNNLQWYDSCGNQEDYSACQYGCQNNTCLGGETNIPPVTPPVPTYTPATFTLSKTVRNLTSGSGFSSSTYANPGDMLLFMVTLQSANNQAMGNVRITDSGSNGLIYKDQLTVSGASYTGNMSSGIYINSISSNQTVTVTYQAQVAPASYFSYGTTTLTNNVSLTSSGYGYNQTASASVVVNKTAIYGATSISTGLTNNFLVDSFLLPLLAVLIGVWLWKSGMFFGIEKWFSDKKKQKNSNKSEKELSDRVQMIREAENI